MSAVHAVTAAATAVLLVAPQSPSVPPSEGTPPPVPAAVTLPGAAPIPRGAAPGSPSGRADEATSRSRARQEPTGGRGRPAGAPAGRTPRLAWPWDALAGCESGGDPAAVSPHGTYRGLFQFATASWRAVGGTGDPAAATVAEQLHRAKALQRLQGWGAWPACAARIGLLP